MLRAAKSDDSPPSYLDSPLDARVDRMYLRNHCSNSLLFLLGERQERQARQPAIVAAKVHGVLYAGDTLLGDNALRSDRQFELQRLGLLVATGLEEKEQFGTFFRQGGG